jgi:WD40 repeat protein
LASRLARARQRLLGSLERRGVVLSCGSFGRFLTQEAMAVPGSAVAAAARLATLCASGDAPLAGLVSSPVAALARGALHTMTLTRLKIVLALAVALCALAAGAGWAANQVAVKPDPERDNSEPTTEMVALLIPPSGEVARTDYYGDPLPAGALVRLGTVQLRHTSGQLAFSADGKTLISAGWDYAVRFWDVRAGKLARSKRLGEPLISESGHTTFFEGLSPDGKILVLMREECLYLYDTGAWKELRRLKVGLTSHHRFVFSPDSKMLATATSLGGRHAMRVWDLGTGKELMVQEDDHGISDLAFSPDGKLLASLDESLRIWETASGLELRNVPTAALSIAFSPDGKTVAAGSRDGKVTLWEAATLTKHNTFKAFSSSNMSCLLTYSPDGALLAVGGSKDLVFWDIANHKEVRRLPEQEVRSLAFAPDGKTLACVGKSEIHLWDVVTGERLHERPGHSDGVHSVSVSPNGKIVATSGWNEPTILLWDAATGKPLLTVIKPGFPVRSCFFSSDGKYVVGGSLSQAGAVCLWAADTGEEVRRFVIKDQHGGREKHEVLVCHLSTGSKRLAAISWAWVKMRESNQLTVWDTKTGEIIACRPFPQTLHSCFTPNGEGVTVDSPERLAIEETTTGRVKTTIPGDLGRPVALSPDAKLAAVGIHETQPQGGWKTRGVRVVELATGQEIFQVDGPIDFVAFSPDGWTVATGDPEALCLWDAATGAPLFRRSWPKDLPGTRHFRTPIESLAFFPDGRAIVTGQGDGTALVWDLAPKTLPTPKVAPDLGPKELDAAWADLAGDAQRAYRTVGLLTSAPTQAVPYLKEHLQAVAEAEPKRVEQLVSDLNSDDFETRKAATETLIKLGERIEPAVRKALEQKPSLEVSQRLATVLDAMSTPTTDSLRAHRAIHALERIGTRDARQVLQMLAVGAATARQTREAKDALERLSASTPSIP